MSFALYGSLFFTMVLLGSTTYFLLGGLPLLILDHDAPLDARFVRGFFNFYYRLAFWAAVGACVCYAGWGRFAFAVGAAGIAVLVTLLRKHLLSAMDRWGSRIEARDAGAIRHFRRMHAMALLANLVLLVVLVWALIRLSLAM